MNHYHHRTIEAEIDKSFANQNEEIDVIETRWHELDLVLRSFFN